MSSRRTKALSEERRPTRGRMLKARLGDYGLNYLAVEITDDDRLSL